MYTQCPECRTVYRVGSSQLRQAQGKVLCGGCGMTFNALESLSEGPPDNSVPTPATPTLGTRPDQPPLSIQDTGEHRKLDMPGDTLVGPAIDFSSVDDRDDVSVYQTWEDALDHRWQSENSGSPPDTIAAVGDDRSDTDDLGDTEGPAREIGLAGDEQSEDSGSPADAQTDSQDDRPDTETTADTDTAPGAIELAGDEPHQDSGSPADTRTDTRDDRPDTETTADTDTAPGAIELAGDEQHEVDGATPDEVASTDDDRSVTDETGIDLAATSADREPDAAQTATTADTMTGGEELGITAPAVESTGAWELIEPDDERHTQSASYTESWAEELLREAEIGPDDVELAIGAVAGDQTGAGMRSTASEPAQSEGQTGAGVSRTSPEAALIAAMGAARVATGDDRAAEDSGSEKTESRETTELIDTDTVAGDPAPGDAFDELQLKTWGEPAVRDDIDVPEAVEGSPGFASGLPRAGMQKPAATATPSWVDQYSEEDFEEIELPGTLDAKPVVAAQSSLDALAGDQMTPAVDAQIGAATAFTPQGVDTAVAGLGGGDSTAGVTSASSSVTASDSDPRGSNESVMPAAGLPLPRELDPASAPTVRRWLMPGLTALLVIAAAATVIHLQRGVLMRNATLAPALSNLYAAFGVPLRARWDVSAFRILDSSASAGTGGKLTVNSRFTNSATYAQPFPILRVSLENRWGQALDRQEFDVGTYLADATGRHMRSNEQAVAVVTLDSPGDEAVGFSVDLCLSEPAGGLRCLSESPRD